MTTLNVCYLLMGMIGGLIIGILSGYYKMIRDLDKLSLDTLRELQLHINTQICRRLKGEKG